MMLKRGKIRGFAAGATLTAVVCTAALGGVVYAFMANSSAYVTVAQAKSSNADRMHLAGELVKETVRQDLSNHTLVFDLKDTTGQVTVVFSGTQPQNMSEATQIVAIGEMKSDGKFYSDNLLVKCPSKYESEQNK